MSIFGQLDAANIPTNPFFVRAGEYSADVVKAYFKKNKKDQNQLIIEYQITEEDSEFLDSRVTQFLTLIDPEMTSEILALLPADEKKAIRRDSSTLKRTLCGSDDNDRQPGLGIAMDDLNDPNWNPQVLVGLKVTIAVSNYGPQNTGVNFRWVNLIQE